MPKKDTPPRLSAEDKAAARNAKASGTAASADKPMSKTEAGKQLTALNKKVRTGGYTAAEQKRAQELATLAGKNPPKWSLPTGAPGGPSGPPAGEGGGTRRSKYGEEVAALAKAAFGLDGKAEFKTPIGGAEVTAVQKALGNKKVGDAIKPMSFAALKRWACDGEKPEKDQMEGFKAIVKDANHKLVWGRKAARILVAIHG